MLETPIKPFLRGHFHQAAFFVALGAGAMLIGQAHGLRSISAAIIYSISLLTMLGVSALYHRPKWKEEARLTMKRLDHAAIYVSIAGTGTPVCLLALPDPIGFRLLSVMWVSCALGMLKSILWVSAPKWIGAVLYVAVGWIYGYYLPEIKAALTPAQFWIIIAGGIVHTVGALVYASRRPNPAPRVFGYHEIFHVLTIVAATLHFLVMRQLIV